MPRQKSVTPRSNPPHKSYKHIAVIFVILAILLALGVTYLALSRVTITLVPTDEKITHSFNLTLADQSATSTPGQLTSSGKILSDQIESQGNFSVAEGKTVDAVAAGKVTIYNNRERSQGLVATTRLLSPDNILFRLEDQVTIPVAGRVETQVYADQKGPSGNIAPTSFTIPGLSESLQKLVYAESKTPMTGGTKQVGILTDSDIERAKLELEKNASQELLTKFITQLDEAKLSLLETESQASDFSYSEEIGDEIDSFTLSANLSLQAVFADKDELLKVAKNELKKSQGPKGEFVSVDPASLEYQLLDIDPDKKEAHLEVKISGLSSFDPDKDIFDKNLLVGFTEDDLNLYFSQFDSIKDIQVEFSPFWVKKVPILRDHITIEIAE